MEKDHSNLFAGIPVEFTDKAKAAVWLQSIPYDGTSTYVKGADKGFEAFMEAATQVELYDIETNTEVYKKGIHVLPELSNFTSPEAMFKGTYENTKQLLPHQKLLTFFGGEHSISIGIIKAFYEHFEKLTLVQIDAHADQRSEYNGTPYNHACAVYDAGQHCNLVQVGIRSMDEPEKANMNYEQTYFAHQIQKQSNWMQQSINQMTDTVYITFDLDAFDPSIMPATGTPEPGGLLWYETLTYLKMIFEQKNVVGFDIVELAPIKNLHHPQFLVAKLYYKMLSYKFMK